MNCHKISYSGVLFVLVSSKVIFNFIKLVCLNVGKISKQVKFKVFTYPAVVFCQTPYDYLQTTFRIVFLLLH